MQTNANEVTQPRKIVRNIRYGLATNSSSSHSIIHNVNISSEPDNAEDREEFGWEFFTLTSKEAKKDYMLAQLACNLDYSSLPTIYFLLDELGHNVVQEKINNLSVDHESVLIFPRYPSGQLDLNFYKEYSDFIINEDFGILGGNDNDDHDHELIDMHDGKSSYAGFLNSKGNISYKNGNYWVIISNTVKHRICFTDETLAPTRPELIDIKITDYCNIGCSFCYQDSTEAGQHADLEVLQKIRNSIRTYDTITEYAIGGGEPTQHPEFSKILKLFGSSMDKVAFTTKNKEWFSDADVVNSVKEYCSAIAYSCTTVEQVSEFHNLHYEAGLFDLDAKVSKPVKFYIHLIPELLGPDRFREIMSWIEEQNRSWGKIIHVTCLGYKPIGRANKDYQLVPEFVDIITKLLRTQVGIDTKFAKDYQDLLDAKGISRDLYTTEEGQYSMYIDAVEKKAYKSSWQLEHPVDISAPFGNSNREIYHEVDKVFSEIQQHVPRDGMHQEP